MQWKTVLLLFVLTVTGGHTDELTTEQNQLKAVKSESNTPEIVKNSSEISSTTAANKDLETTSPEIINNFSVISSTTTTNKDLDVSSPPCTNEHTPAVKNDNDVETARTKTVIKESSRPHYVYYPYPYNNAPTYPPPTPYSTTRRPYPTYPSYPPYYPYPYPPGYPFPNGPSYYPPIFAPFPGFRSVSYNQNNDLPRSAVFKPVEEEEYFVTHEKSNSAQQSATKTVPFWNFLNFGNFKK
ncbi:leucine-rich repeat extensin-like protein 1 [Teleopsis dalmanni]|uniref:leucine-rich repeat extensin-like protein 1 n=1 Tax=Teleopsis dalmanni TaxID=139649 RepID=UPI0018CCE4D0|nr:leucine-rich repeat extensin-like protein 1 [Teleopsis dalmanni]